MDALEDFSGSNDHLIIMKGKRNKRPRLPSPVSRAVISSSSLSGGESGHTSGCDDIVSRHRDLCRAIAPETPTATTTFKYGTTGGLVSYAPSFTMSSDDSNESADSSTLEDENMANCLIHLAQSGGCIKQEDAKMKSYTNKRFSEMVSNSTTKIKAGFFVYECKTCNRNFQSFQALGGHRASHKKARILVEDQKTIFPSSKQNLDENEEEEEEAGGKFKRLSDDIISPEFTIKLAHKDLVGNRKAKIHECSICGSEFSSGQALGGHMRRHRNSSNAKVNSIDVKSVETEKPRRVFQLDLNLPAPEDDHRDLKFQFAADQQRLVFASPALVDCHY